MDDEIKKLLRSFQIGETIRILPVSNGKIPTDSFWDFAKTQHYVPSKNIFLCFGDETYVPGKCEICDLLYEKLYLEEYEDSILYI